MALADKYLDGGLFFGTNRSLPIPDKVKDFITFIFRDTTSTKQKIRNPNELFAIVWETDFRGYLKNVIPRPDLETVNFTDIDLLILDILKFNYSELISFYSLVLSEEIVSIFRTIPGNLGVPLIDRAAALLTLHILYMKELINA